MLSVEQQTREVYNEIATHFDKTRYKVWPCVNNFIKTFEPKSLILDIGCGNGKNMLSRSDLIFKGIDLADNLVRICHEKDLDVIQGSMTFLPYDDNTFDGLLVVASYHHLSTDDERERSLNEMYRVLKKGGKCLIVVWAKEQEEDSRFNFTTSDEMVKWDNKSGKTYYRYYHIYAENQLVEEISRLKTEFKIINEGYEKGNWFTTISK